MSSKRKSYDTDEITLRKVFAKSFVNNSAIPAQRVLTADGAGGTYWAIPSTLGLNPSFNQINTTAGNFTADLSYNIFTLTAQTGIGFSKGAGSNELNIYGKAFNQIDVSGNNTLYGFTNNVVTPTVKFAGAGGITVLGDPDTNTITFTAQGTQISTSQFSFARAQVFSNVSTVIDNLNTANSVTMNAASPSSTLRYVGLSDILLSTNVTTNTVFFTLRSNTGVISTINANLSNVSTNYVNKTDFSTATEALASTSSGYYGILSTGLSTLSTTIGNATVNLSTFNLSTTNVFTSTINFNDITNGSLNTLAVSSGTLTLNGQGIVATAGLTTQNLVSTVAGLGTAGYISTLSTNQLSTGWLKTGIAEVSSISFKDTGNTNIYGLFSSNASLYFNNAPVGGGTVINNSNYSTYIYQVSSVSTLYAYANTVNISTVTNAFLNPSFFSTKFFSTGDLTVSSISLKDRTTNALQYVTVDNGFLKLNTSTVTLVPDLVSSIVGLGTAGYISSATLISSVQTGLVSTVTGLGSAGYISSSQLGSTVVGLGAAGFVSTGQLVSTVIGLGTARYISSTQLTSTVLGLGAAGFVSTGQLVSSVIGLGTLGYISSSQLGSTVVGLGATGFVSTGQLVSSLVGLGGIGYVSTSSLISTVENGLVSTVIGLGSAGYISSTQLTSSIAGSVVPFQLASTVAGLVVAGYVSSGQLTSTTAGIGVGGVTKITAGTNVTISPTNGLGNVTINASGGGGASFTAFSTVLISTLSTTVNPTIANMDYINYSTFTFPGPGGLPFPNRFSQLSSVQFKIDSLSSYITSTANMYVGIQYNYTFGYWQGPDYIDQNPIVNVSNFFSPTVGISTTLLLGQTPGNYLYDIYSPSLLPSTTVQYANNAGTQSFSVLASNAYSKNQMFQLPKTSFQNLYTSSFTLYSVLLYGRKAPGSNVFGPYAGTGSNPSGFSGFSAPQVLVTVGSNNPITLYVTN